MFLPGHSIAPARRSASGVIEVHGLTLDSLNFAGDCRVRCYFATTTTVEGARQDHPVATSGSIPGIDPTRAGVKQRRSFASGLPAIALRYRGRGLGNLVEGLGSTTWYRATGTRPSDGH